MTTPCNVTRAICNVTRAIRRLSTVLAVIASVSFVCKARAEDYPNRPITMIVPFAAGGPTDMLARMLAQAHRVRSLGQQVVIENVTGAGGTIGAAKRRRGAPDGYTMVMGNLGTHAASLGIYKNLPYDPRTDFEPVMLVATTPMVLVARKDAAGGVARRRHRLAKATKARRPWAAPASARSPISRCCCSIT